MARRNWTARAPRRDLESNVVASGTLDGSSCNNAVPRTLDPDVARMFKTPQAVNDALRTAAWLGIMQSFKASSTHTSRSGQP